MADDRERNEGMKQGGAHEAPGRNRGTGQEAGDKGNLGGQQLGGQQGGQKKPDQEGSFKEGDQKEQTRS